MKKHQTLLALLALTGSAIAAEKPEKVYILAAQSNMVGTGQVSSGGARPRMTSAYVPHVRDYGATSRCGRLRRAP